MYIHDISVPINICASQCYHDFLSS